MMKEMLATPGAKSRRRTLPWEQLEQDKDPDVRAGVEKIRQRPRHQRGVRQKRGRGGGKDNASPRVTAQILAREGRLTTNPDVQERSK